MTEVRITEVSIGGVPCPVVAFNVNVDHEEVFISVRREGVEFQRIKVDLRKALEEAQKRKAQHEWLQDCGTHYCGHCGVDIDHQKATEPCLRRLKKDEICSGCGVARERCPRVVLGLSALACCPDCSHASVTAKRNQETPFTNEELKRLQDSPFKGPNDPYPKSESK